jgi:hypothetical protein
MGPPYDGRIKKEGELAAFLHVRFNSGAGALF